MILNVRLHAHEQLQAIISCRDESLLPEYNRYAQANYLYEGIILLIVLINKFE